MAAGQGFVAVVGARVLPEAVAPQVADVVRCFLSRGWGIGSGGARGADAYALNAVVAAGPAACARSVVFLPGAVPAGAEALDAFVGAGRACGARRRRGPGRSPPALTAAGAGVGRRGGVPVGAVARVGVHGAGSDPGGEAGGGGARRRRGRPARVRRGPVGAVLLRVGARVPVASGAAGPVAAVVARAGLSGAGGRADARAARAHRRLERGRAAVVRARHPRGRHGAGRARGPVRHAGLPRHPGADAALPVRRPRGRGTRRALPGARRRAGRRRPLRRRGAAAWASRRSSPTWSTWSRASRSAEQAPETDALEHADALGDGVEWVDERGRVAQAAMQPEAEAVAPAVQWHALGTVQPERVTCPVCRAQAEADPDASDLPTCPECGTRDTWEARQGGRFRGIVGAIDTCPSLEELAALGKRLYALALTARSGWRGVVALPRAQDGARAGRDAPAARARPGRSRGARPVAIPAAARGRSSTGCSTPAPCPSPRPSGGGSGRCTGAAGARSRA